MDYISYCSFSYFCFKIVPFIVELSIGLNDNYSFLLRSFKHIGFTGYSIYSIFVFEASFNSFNSLDVLLFIDLIEFELSFFFLLAINIYSIIFNFSTFS